MTELTIAISDFMLSLVCSLLAISIQKTWERRSFWSVRLVTCSLAFTALSSFFGGVWHGFLPNAIVWYCVSAFVGLSAATFFAAVVFSSVRRWRLPILALLVAQTCVYLILSIFFDDFLLVVSNYVPLLCASLVFEVGLVMRERPGSFSVSVGILLSLLAALVQVSGTRFNNELYHLVSAVSSVFVYKGGRIIIDA